VRTEGHANNHVECPADKGAGEMSMNVSKVVAGCAMVIAATCGTAIAEVPAGRIFVFHSTA